MADSNIRKRRKKTFIKRKYQRQIKEADKQSTKMEMTELLAAKFNLSKIEILVAYEKFHKKYPDGLICKEKYMEENKVVFDLKVVQKKC